MNESSISKVQRSATRLVLIALLFSALICSKGLRTNPHFHASSKGTLQYDHANGDGGGQFSKGNVKEEVGTELYPTGSSLPDCSHACGPCVPCKRVMVSYKCATESCPVVYRCMCKGKYYHVPSN